MDNCTDYDSENKIAIIPNCNLTNEENIVEVFHLIYLSYVVVLLIKAQIQLLLP